MNKEEYIEDLAVLKKVHEEQILNLQRRYAKENNPYKIGDVITDHRLTIRIEKFTTYINFSTRMPEMVYHGVVLKKDGTDNYDRKGEIVRDQVHQSNINK